MNWLLKAESATPALLLEARGELFTQTAVRGGQAPGAQLIATSYQSFDPLVLSLTAALRWRGAYRQSEQRWNPGINWSLSSQVNFAVNHRVTLFGGVSYSHRERTRIDGVPQGRAVNDVGFRLGLGFTPAIGNSLFVSGEYQSSAAGAVSLQWLREL